ncbi:MAG TPA: primosomal protein N', partial [Burkholderiaceae bacterium]|nr:primosomal protein N' [Burkholderiaceae bacterium]
MSADRFARVAIDAPVLADATGGDLYDYRLNGLVAAPGQLVLVPFGRRVEVGVVVETTDASALAPDRLRDVMAVVGDVAPLSRDWLALGRFAASYYHRPLGE